MRLVRSAMAVMHLRLQPEPAWISGLFRKAREAPATEHNTTFTSGLVLAAHRYLRFAVRIQRNRDHDRPAAHLAVLDVLLFAGGVVDEQLDRFAAVRASGVDGGQHRVSPGGDFVRGASVHPSHRAAT